jgi:hypothetical protein
LIRPRVAQPIADPEVAAAVALRLAEDLVRTFMEQHQVSRSEAVRQIRDRGQAGRTPSGVMRGRRG